MGESTKPIIRIVRNLARSGGTLVGKCIGCMDSVTLISEIHPAELQTTNPMMQASQWFDLIGKKDLQRWKIRPPSMLQFVMLCDARAKENGSHLVLRDWSHLDYIGVPFTTPKHGFELGDALEPVFDIRVSVTTRHPIDQYLSLLQLGIVQPHLELESYCLGCRKFAEYASNTGFHRYEDFTLNPNNSLQKICDELELPFDAGYRNKWYQYTTITGDTVPTLGRGSQQNEIVHMPRKPIEDSLVNQFRANADYQRACELLGYEP